MSLEEKVEGKERVASSKGSVDVSAGDVASDVAALQALEKRVLRKTDMIVLPTVCAYLNALPIGWANKSL